MATIALLKSMPLPFMMASRHVPTSESWHARRAPFHLNDQVLIEFDLNQNFKRAHADIMLPARHKRSGYRPTTKDPSPIKN